MFLDTANYTSKLDFYQDSGIPAAPAFVAPVVIKPTLSSSFLQVSDIGAFWGIQERVKPTLQQDYHLKEKDELAMAYHFDRMMTGVGVKMYENDQDEKGILMGGCLLSYMGKEDGLKKLSGYPIKTSAESTTLVVHTLCVDPAYAKRGISSLVLQAAFCVAAEKKMTQIVSAVADDNEASIRTFKRAGYKPFAQGIDKKLGYAKTFYQLPVFGCDAA